MVEEGSDLFPDHSSLGRCGYASCAPYSLIVDVIVIVVSFDKLLDLHWIRSSEEIRVVLCLGFEG